MGLEDESLAGYKRRSVADPFGKRLEFLQHDPEKRRPGFGKHHAPTKDQAVPQ
jgi:hypothetical protein